jgi:hypothetical protein
METIRFTALLVGLSLSAIAVGQSDLADVHQSTSTPPNARYEIVQSELTAKWTFRLDRYTGHVWQLVRAPDESNAWEAVKVISLPTIAAPLVPRFQIFASGLAAKFTFLIDTLSGQTWTLVARHKTNKDGTTEDITSWQPFGADN